MWQPGWEGSLGENGYMYMYGWVPSLFTWNYHSIPAWRIPWTEEPGGLQSREWQRIGHDWACTNITASFISYTTIQDKKFKINKWYLGPQWLHWWFELNFWHLANSPQSRKLAFEPLKSPSWEEICEVCGTERQRRFWFLALQDPVSSSSDKAIMHWKGITIISPVGGDVAELSTQHQQACFLKWQWETLHRGASS